MVVAISMWSIDVVPGKKFNLPVERDFRITNACLGELVDETGRSLVKVEVDEANDESDEEEDDEERVETWKTVLCSLRAGQTEQATLDITFLEGQQVSFEVTGKNTVYLSGNYIDQDEGADMPPFGDDDEDDSDLDGPGYNLEDVSSDVEMDPRELVVGDSDESDDEDRFEELAPEPAADSKKRPRPSDMPAEDEKLSKAQRKKLAKKLKAEDGSAVPAGKSEKVKSADTEKPKNKDEKKPKADKSKPKADEKSKGKTGEDDKPKSKKAAGEPRTLAGGLIVQDVVSGTGPAAKKGQKLSMRYIGKFTNGKVFDKNTGGAPFSFKLGRGDVIKGWDEGLVGMQPGGERLLTIPGNLAYGSKPPPGIPKNATLIFEVKLLSAV